MKIYQVCSQPVSHMDLRRYRQTELTNFYTFYVKCMDLTNSTYVFPGL